MKRRAFLAGAVLVALGFFLRGPVLPRRAPKLPGGRPIRVEVLNGSTVAKAGLGLAEALRAKGFDVVTIDNADRSDYRETLVLDRVGEMSYAAAVARELGTEPSFLQKNPDLLLEVTVILGEDQAHAYVPVPGGAPR
ncbi:MAG: hypothetical protein DHS20C21_16190 [Gemmatimonadota bacterium]|nr:MAG: hypothetical protein DHS20C21_16190 [Gemmatimonadota bacterium]